VSAPTTQVLLTQWNWEPSVLIGLFLFSAAYFYITGPLRQRHNLGPPVSRGQQVLFVVSMVVVALALLSPLDYLGDQFLFSAHMVQHLLLAAVWPPLLLLSLPSWLARRLFRQRGLSSIATFCTFPAVAIAAFNINIYLWHIPVLYDLTLQNEGVHILEHLSFMAFGVLNWWPVLSPAPEQRLSYPLQVLYLFADGMFMMVLGILFTFAPTVFYPPYAAAPRLWGISALTDQQLGGLIMWYPGNLPYAVWLVIAFYRWFEGDQLTPAEAQNLLQESPTIGPRAL
jgi:putative membrane protein